MGPPVFVERQPVKNPNLLRAANKVNDHGYEDNLLSNEAKNLEIQRSSRLSATWREGASYGELDRFGVDRTQDN